MSVKWTPERLAKFQKTMAQRKRAKGGKASRGVKPNGVYLRAAISQLEKAQEDVISRLRSGELKKLQHSDHLVGLALELLYKEQHK